jgi:hypothetical protein
MNYIISGKPESRILSPQCPSKVQSRIVQFQTLHDIYYNASRAVVAHFQRVTLSVSLFPLIVLLDLSKGGVK